MHCTKTHCQLHALSAHATGRPRHTVQSCSAQAGRFLGIFSGRAAALCRPRLRQTCEKTARRRLHIPAYPTGAARTLSRRQCARRLPNKASPRSAISGMVVGEVAQGPGRLLLHARALRVAAHRRDQGLDPTVAGDRRRSLLFRRSPFPSLLPLSLDRWFTTRGRMHHFQGRTGGGIRRGERKGKEEMGSERRQLPVQGTRATIMNRCKGSWLPGRGSETRSCCGLAPQARA